MTLKVRILQSLTWLFIILVNLTMSLFSEKNLIFNRCISGLMSNMTKKSWKVSNPHPFQCANNIWSLQHSCSVIRVCERMKYEESMSKIVCTSEICLHTWLLYNLILIKMSLHNNLLFSFIHLIRGLHGFLQVNVYYRVEPPARSKIYSSRTTALLELRSINHIILMADNFSSSKK